MKKYLFLDIDGVLAVPEYLKDGQWAICPKRQELLHRILSETGAEIVLSSSWRKWDLESTREFMKGEGFLFHDKIIGVTIRAYQYLDRTKKIHLSIPRGVEIKQWLDTNVHSDNGHNFIRKTWGFDYTYCILDDETDMLYNQRNFFVHTDSIQGLTEEKADEVIEILNNKILP